MNIKVSIGVPVYGVEKYIERCARSLFEQTYDNIEFLFVNDCTKDHSIEILSNTLKEYPHRKDNVKIINHEHNKGLGSARNTAVSLATGDYIVWVDSDDYIELDAIEKMVNACDFGKVDMVLASYVAHYPNGRDRVVKHPIVDDLPQYKISIVKQQCPYVIWSRLIKLSLYRDNNISVEEGIDNGEDLQVSAVLSYYSNRIVSIDDILWHYDCTNLTSYNHTFSPKKQYQMWKSFDIVSNFFGDKGIVYYDAIQIAHLLTVINHLIIWGKYSNLDYFYEEAINRLKTIDNSYWKFISLPLKMVIVLSKFKTILKLYVKLATKLRSMF